MRIALIGAGRMGTLHARVVRSSPDASLDVVIDSDLLKADLLASTYGSRSTTSVEAALACDAAIVATPPGSHLEIAGDLMNAGIPVLVEKPLAPTVREAEELVALSRSTGVAMTCGFVERFNPVIATARHVMEEYGQALHLVSVRHSPPDPLVAVDVVQDLLIHDADLALRLCAGEWTGEVKGATWSPAPGSWSEIADCTLTFDSGALATLSASRMSQRKVRQLNLSTPRALIELDLIRRTITVFRHVSHQTTDGSGYRADTVMDIPFVREAGEPLALQFAHFLRLASGAADPVAERDGLLAPHQIAAGFLLSSAPL
jgi:predicted dehydrogenase